MGLFSMPILGAVVRGLSLQIVLHVFTTSGNNNSFKSTFRA